MTLAEELSHYAYSLKYNDISENIVHESKKRIIDALGCGIGAFNAEPVKFSRKIAERAKVNDGSTLLGTRRTTTPDMASFVNGIMIRYFDYNDTYLSRASSSQRQPRRLPLCCQLGRCEWKRPPAISRSCLRDSMQIL